jgi:hypothetical protein
MRLNLKLAVIVAVGVGLQALLTRYESEIDEAQFAIRTLVAHLRGGLPSDEPIMDAAEALHWRQEARFARRYANAASANATTRPDETRAASIADELEWSLRDGTP